MLEAIPLCFVPACGEDYARSIPSSSPTKAEGRFCGDPIVSLVRYPMQSNLLPLVIRCQHVIEGHDCHIFADVLRWHGVLIAGV